MSTQKLIPLESEEQKTLVDYLEIQKNLGNILKFTSIPNSTYTNSWKQKTHNREMGLRRGLPDLLVVTATGYLLFIELKRIRGSSTTKDQKEWIRDINLCNPAKAQVCKGAGEAIEFIEEYLPHIRSRRVGSHADCNED